MNPILNVYFSPNKIVKMIILSSFILVVGFYFAKSALLVIQALGILQMMLGLSVLFIALKAMFTKRPQIIIDETGIMDHRILKQRIPWNQIEKLEFSVINSQRFLQLHVNENFGLENFKFLFLQTSRQKLAIKPRQVLMNLDQLKVNYKDLSAYLSAKRDDFVDQHEQHKFSWTSKVLNKLLH